MGVISKFLFLLAFVWPVSLGVADVYPIYPKYQQSEVSSLVEQDTQRINRRLQADEKTTLFNIQGNSYPDGLSYMIAFISNSPKTFFLDIDTGSDLTWLQCDDPCQSFCQDTPSMVQTTATLSGIMHGSSVCSCAGTELF
ncbi:hypothetical protein SUGI_0478950 [Cryptomeria japonica]|nr:hypothetical protein SUGI_0478950 [Cryptomeria japonica]